MKIYYSILILLFSATSAFALTGIDRENIHLLTFPVMSVQKGIKPRTEIGTLASSAFNELGIKRVLLSLHTASYIPYVIDQLRLTGSVRVLTTQPTQIPAHDLGKVEVFIPDRPIFKGAKFDFVLLSLPSLMEGYEPFESAGKASIIIDHLFSHSLYPGGYGLLATGTGYYKESTYHKISLKHGLNKVATSSNGWHLFHKPL